jgi:hypothetical protein
MERMDNPAPRDPEEILVLLALRAIVVLLEILVRMVNLPLCVGLPVLLDPRERRETPAPLALLA